MPDITKCWGQYCKLKEKCLRFTQPANNIYQSFFAGIPLNKDGTCDYYIHAVKKRRVVRKKKYRP